MQVGSWDLNSRLETLEDSQTSAPILQREPTDSDFTTQSQMAATGQARTVGTDGPKDFAEWVKFAYG